MTDSPGAVSWVIGRGGLLGRSTEAALAKRSDPWHPGEPIRWDAPDAASALQSAVTAFARWADGRPWSIGWCAGTGVTASTQTTLDHESDLLDAFLEQLGAERAGPLAGDGALFVASSAGAVYAGSSGAPFHEATEPAPIAAYGRTKLVQERRVSEWSRHHDIPTLIGRIANLYGPGQDLGKPQGLISHLCWQQLVQQPIGIYVPLDTIRDYLFAPDCGRMVAAGLASLASRRREDGAGPVVKVLASQRPVTISSLLGEFKRVMRRNVLTSMRSSDLSRFQSRDLRLESRVLPELDELATTLLCDGLFVTHEDLRLRLALAGPGGRARSG